MSFLYWEAHIVYLNVYSVYRSIQCLLKYIRKHWVYPFIHLSFYFCYLSLHVYPNVPAHLELVRERKRITEMVRMVKMSHRSQRRRCRCRRRGRNRQFCRWVCWGRQDPRLEPGTQPSRSSSSGGKVHRLLPLSLNLYYPFISCFPRNAIENMHLGIITRFNLKEHKNG